MAAMAQTDSLDLSIEQLFERGMKHSLPIEADRLQESIAREEAQTARRNLLPDIEVGLRGAFVGQPVVWQHGLSDATRPKSPHWSQNYAVDFTQPLYEGGRLKYAVRRADLQRRIAALQTATDRADIKLTLLDHYLELFSLYKQHLVLRRNIDESERRLVDIRRMKREGGPEGHPGLADGGDPGHRRRLPLHPLPQDGARAGHPHGRGHGLNTVRPHRYMYMYHIDICTCTSHLYVHIS